jgi:hypothetical protein
MVIQFAGDFALRSKLATPPELDLFWEGPCEPCSSRSMLPLSLVAVVLFDGGEAHMPPELPLRAPFGVAAVSISGSGSLGYSLGLRAFLPLAMNPPIASARSFSISLSCSVNGWGGGGCFTTGRFGIDNGVSSGGAVSKATLILDKQVEENRIYPLYE